MRTTILPGTADRGGLARTRRSRQGARADRAGEPAVHARPQRVVRLPDSLVAGLARARRDRHARAAHYRLRDLKSTNGTFVNGKRIDEHRLADGDLFVIADVEFSFRRSGDEGVRKTVTQVMDHGGESGEDRVDDAVGRPDPRRPPHARNAAAPGRPQPLPADLRPGREPLRRLRGDPPPAIARRAARRPSKSWTAPTAA